MLILGLAPWQLEGRLFSHTSRSKVVQEGTVVVRPDW